MNEADERELGRLRWRCRRGMRELDQMLGRYLDREWRQSSTEERNTFLLLLETEDDRLWHWMMGNQSPENPELRALVDKIRLLPP